jgi:hypothetical protein
VLLLKGGSASQKLGDVRPAINAMDEAAERAVEGGAVASTNGRRGRIPEPRKRALDARAHGLHIAEGEGGGEEAHELLIGGIGVPVHNAQGVGRQTSP